MAREKRKDWDEYEEELSPRERRERDARRSAEEEELNARERRERMERSRQRDDDFEEQPRKKAPLPLRLLAWVALISIFFAVGYGGTNLFFKWLDSRGDRRPDGVVATLGDAERFVNESRSADAPATDKSRVCVIYIPNGTTFDEREIKTSREVPEDAIADSLAAYLDGMKESQWFDPSVQSLNIFSSGEWLYVNMNSNFWTSLKTLGKDKAKLALTGIVQTISHNFPPIVKVKFYVDGKERKDKEPVDLSLPWKLPGKS